MLAIFQLDAASLETVERLMSEGRMPALAELRSRGRWERLGEATDLFEAGLFPTLYGGTEIADHGLYYPMIWSQEKQAFRYMGSFDRPELAWEQLDRVGVRSLVIDPYQLWRPASPRNGVWFSGWQFTHKIIPSFYQPAAEFIRAVRRHGRPALLADIAGPRTAARLLEMLDVLEPSSKRASDLFTDLLARETFDVAWVNLSAVHHAGHHLWDLSQVRGPIADEESARLENGMIEVYMAADAALGQMVEALPAGADVVVMSPLGMGPNSTRSDLLPGMLSRILAGGPLPEGGGGTGEGVWRVRARLPALRQAANRMLPGSAVRAILGRLYSRGIDWGSVRAFALPGDHFGSVRFNVRGREREGIVEPPDAGALADEITTGLLTFSDVDGGPAIVDVHRPQAELSGERVEMLPDLVVRWTDQPATRLEGVDSPQFGRVSRLAAGVGRPGGHRDGAFVLTVPGRSRTAELGRPPDLIDLAATACSAASIDGLPGQSLFD